MAGRQQTIQRRVNLLTVLDELRAGPHTISELAAATGTTRPTVEAVVEELNTLGWLTQLPDEGGMGRPAARWEAASDVNYVVALDIGAHHVTTMVANPSGQILRESTSALGESDPADRRLEAVVEQARTCVARSGVGWDAVSLCVAASPGVIDDGNILYFGGDGMPGWAGTDLSGELRSQLGVPTLVAGDCALGALGEAWQGAAEGQRDVVYVLSGQRTGAAAIIDGRVHQGHRGSAGLVGELPVLRWREIEDEMYGSTLGSSRPDRDEIFRRAALGDPAACQAVDDFADALALGAAAMALAIGPSHVVVGGRFSAYADVFLDRFRTTMLRWCPIKPQVCASRLGARAIGLGAVRFAMMSLHESLRTEALNTPSFPAAGPYRPAV